jgi:hypothetical protein
MDSGKTLAEELLEKDNKIGILTNLNTQNKTD